MWSVARSDVKAEVAGVEAPEDLRQEHTQSRIRAVDSMCERYYQTLGSKPNPAVLDRLGSLILLDELTDSHADKMTREEYPIMSDSQLERNNRRYVVRDELPFGDLRFLGRRKITASIMGDEDGAEGGRTSSIRRILDTSNDDYAKVDDKLKLEDLLNAAKLTDRQRQAIELVYFDNLTQEKAGKAMGGIRKHTVNEHIMLGLGKLRAIFSINAELLPV